MFILIFIIFDTSNYITQSKVHFLLNFIKFLCRKMLNHASITCIYLKSAPIFKTFSKNMFNAKAYKQTNVVGQIAIFIFSFSFEISFVNTNN